MHDRPGHALVLTNITGNQMEKADDELKWPPSPHRGHISNLIDATTFDVVQAPPSTKPLYLSNEIELVIHTGIL